MSATVLTKAVSLVFERLAISAASLGVPGASTLATQVRVIGTGIEGLTGIAEGAAEGQPPWLTALAVGLGIVLGTAGAIVLAPELAAVAAAALGITATAGLEAAASVAASYFIAKGVQAGVNAIAGTAPQLGQAFGSIAQDAGGVFTGVLPPQTPLIPSNVMTWGSGVPSDASYIQLGSDLSPTDTTITVTGQSAATAKAFGTTPSGPSFTLSFNADGTVNEAVQNVTLDQNRTTLDGNDNITITGVLSVAPGIDGSLTGTSLTNDGTINVGDPTSLAISASSLINDGLIEVDAGSKLAVGSLVVSDDGVLALRFYDPDATGNSFVTEGGGILGPDSSVLTYTAEVTTADPNPWTAYYGSLGTAPYLYYGLNDAVLATMGNLNDVVDTSVYLYQGGPLGERIPETIAYTFSAPIPAGKSFFLLDPGAYQSSGGPYGRGVDDGPSTFSFSASLGGASVATSGWTFVPEASGGELSKTTYSVDASTGVVTVTNYDPAFPGGSIIVTTNTPIDSIKVSASTLPADRWGLAFPQDQPKIDIGSGSDVDLENSVDEGQTVVFGAGGTLDLGQPATFAATISNFAPGDVIDLGAPQAFAMPATTGLFRSAASLPAAYSIVDFDSQTNALDIGTSTGSTFALQFALSDALSINDFRLTPDAAGGSDLSLACYLAGSRIRTREGERPIDDLAIGEVVHTHFSGFAPIKWIGRRRIDCRRHPDPRKVWPVRVRAGAFGEVMPCRDLWLSPDHAVFVNDALIPIQYLINGSTVAQEPRDEVTYYHVELDQHDVLLAEGLPCESYLDTGNRSNFANEGTSLALHPDFSSLAWEALGCAPLVITGPALEAVQRRLQARADEGCGNGRQGMLPRIVTSTASEPPTMITVSMRGYHHMADLHAG